MKPQRQCEFVVMIIVVAVAVTLLCPGSTEAGKAVKKKTAAAEAAPVYHHDLPLEEEPLIDQIAMESIDAHSPPVQSIPNSGYVSILPAPHQSASYSGFKINPNCKCGKSPYTNDDKEGNPHPWTAAIFYDNPPTSSNNNQDQRNGQTSTASAPMQVQTSSSDASSSSSRLLFCTGTLINDRYVLTASRCVQGLNATDLQVWLSEKGMWSDQKIMTGRLGQQRQYEEDNYLKKIPVEKIIIHPDFSPSTLNHEVALIRLSIPVKLSRRKRDTGSSGGRRERFFTTPVCLPKYDVMEMMNAEGTSYINGIKGTVVGWDKKGRTSYSLVQAQVPFVNGIEKCVEMTNKTAVLNENMFCAGKIENGVASDSCSMDTGSPLVIYENGGSGGSKGEDVKGHYTLVGVSSWLYGCTNLQNVNVIYDVIFPDNTAKPQVPGVYARIEKYRDWITHNTLDAVWCA